MGSVTPFDLLLGSILPLAFGAFALFGVLARFCIDFESAAELERKHEFRDSFHIFPPARLLKSNWKWVARFRDVAGFTLAIILFFFTMRAVLLAAFG